MRVKLAIMVHDPPFGGGYATSYMDHIRLATHFAGLAGHRTNIVDLHLQRREDSTGGHHGVNSAPCG